VVCESCTYVLTCYSAHSADVVGVGLWFNVLGRATAMSEWFHFSGNQVRHAGDTISQIRRQGSWSHVVVPAFTGTIFIFLAGPLWC